MQRELPWWGLFGEVAYVGDKGDNLIRQPDINRPTFAPRGEPGGAEVQHELPAAVQGLLEHPPAPDRRVVELQRAQMFLSRRRDLNFTLNYTYSKA